MKHKIGIFIGYGPGATNIRKEGLGRLLAFLLSGAIERDDMEILICMPGWWRKEFNALLDDQKIARNHFEVIQTPTPNIMLLYAAIEKMRRFFRNEPGDKEKRKTKNEFVQFIKRTAKKSVKKIILGSGSGKLVLILISSVVAAGLGVFSLYPWKLLKKIESMLRRVLRGVLKKAMEPLDNIRESYFLRNLYERVYKHELSRLADIAGRRTDVDVWYAPTAFWPEINKIKKPTVVCMPDLVFLDFATRYAGPGVLELTERMTAAVDGASAVITYSHHIKEHQLQQCLGLIDKPIYVIANGGIDTRRYLIKESDEDGGVALRKRALEIIKGYQEQSKSNYLIRTISFSTLKYIFYSSQVRHHKNLAALLRAFSIVRETHPDLNLVLTANYDSIPELEELISELCLKPYVISCHNVSSEVLAALNHLAVCAVTPTLFEGGFPFTFSEAYSVGTPSVMSAIPVVLERIRDRELRKKMLFDPYDEEDMAQKICWAISNREHLIEIQEDLYKFFHDRTWEKVVDDYFAVFSETAQQGAIR